jgi:hypothetical protein
MIAYPSRAPLPVPPTGIKGKRPSAVASRPLTPAVAADGAAIEGMPGIPSMEGDRRK